MAASVKGDVSAGVSDAAATKPVLQELQRHVQQLQLAVDTLHLQPQQPQCSDGPLNELKVQCLQLKHEIEGINQQQLRFAHIDSQQKQLFDRLAAAELFQSQLRESQLELQQRLHNELRLLRERDFSDLHRLVEDKFAGILQRMTQLESQRDSWATIERLVLSSGSGNGSGSGSGLQASQCSHAMNEANSYHQDFSSSGAIGDSYVALQTSDVVPASALAAQPVLSLRLTSVGVQFQQQELLPLQLVARGENSGPTDADYSVSIVASVQQFFFDLQVFFFTPLSLAF
jgi:hypothetical protein